MSGRRVWISGLAVAMAAAVAVALVIRCVLLGPSPALASFTTLSVISGTVEVQDEGASEFRPAVDGETLEVGDTVRTGPDSRALITFFEGSTMEMEPETEVTMQKLEGEEDGGFFTQIGQSLGVTWHRVVEFADPASRYEVETPSGVAAVRGTLFQLEVKGDGTTIADTLKGRVALIREDVEVVVGEGKRGFARLDKPLEEPVDSPLPEMTLELELGSPALPLILTPEFTAAGWVRPGYPVNQVPGTTTSVPPEEPQVVLLRRVVDGEYEVYLFGMASGMYHLVIAARADGRVVCQREFYGTVDEGENWRLAVEVKVRGGSLRSCTIGGPERVLEDPDIALAMRDSLLNRYPEARFVSGPSPTAKASPTAARGTPTPTAPTATPAREVLGATAVPTPSPRAPTPTPAMRAVVPTATPTASPTAAGATSTPVPKQPTATPVPSVTPIPLATATPVSSATPTPVSTATAVATATGTVTTVPTGTPTYTPVPPTATATATATPTLTLTPTPTVTLTPTPTPTYTPTPTSTSTPTPTATYTPTPSPTSTPTATPLPEEISIELKWGTEAEGAPQDLDAHLSGPVCGSSDRFHVWFYNRNPVSYAGLDRDIVTWVGPETITIHPFNGGWVPGEYDFWVHIFTSDAGYGTSRAVVTISKGGAQLAQYSVGGEAGVEDTTFNIWRVVNLTVDENGGVTLNRNQHGFLSAPPLYGGAQIVPDPITPFAFVPCPGSAP